MENATKALLIAAAILIAILIISLGLVVYNMAAETMNGLDMTEAQVTQFNDKFKKFEGTSVSESTVNSLITTVINHNLNNDDDARQVTINVANSSTGATAGDATISGGDAVLSLQAHSTSASGRADTGLRYVVTCEYNSKTALITNIKIDEKK